MISGRAWRGALVGAVAAWALVACVPPATPPPAPETPEIRELESLVLVFYARVSNRRFNSISTFHDPALREFFQTPEAFADYYADFAQALMLAHFDYNRPIAFEILGFEVAEPESARVEVLLRGANNQPLRFWGTSLTRTDRWRYVDGHWWIIPGKL